MSSVPLKLPDTGSEGTCGRSRHTGSVLQVGFGTLFRKGINGDTSSDVTDLHMQRREFPKSYVYRNSRPDLNRKTEYKKMDRYKPYKPERRPDFLGQFGQFGDSSTPLGLQSLPCHRAIPGVATKRGDGTGRALGGLAS